MDLTLSTSTIKHCLTKYYFGHNLLTPLTQGELAHSVFCVTSGGAWGWGPLHFLDKSCGKKWRYSNRTVKSSYCYITVAFSVTADFDSCGRT